jgi:hypothetical protein
MNKALETAQRKGRLAFFDGYRLGDCPYADKRTIGMRNGVTFSRAFIRAWTAGWVEAAKQDAEKKRQIRAKARAQKG